MVSLQLPQLTAAAQQVPRLPKKLLKKGFS
jgi:hypothetical protein